jgi:arsenite-transporting ATPase
MELFPSAARILFFTGKGGVGKTSLACATAVALADRGRRVLLVSTDPASNLDEVLGVTLGNHPTLVTTVANLSAMNLDPQAAAAEYRERMVGPYRALLPASAITSMEEQFSGSCTVEIAAFDEFSRLLGDPSATADFDHVIIDTAPTGHTLRLLTLPSAWSEFMAASTTGASCLGPLAGLQSQQRLYEATARDLGDATMTTLVLVARPEPTALREAARTSGELAALGILNQHLIVNGLFSTTQTDDPLALALQGRMERALTAMPAELESLPRTTVRLSASGVLGIKSLRALASGAGFGDSDVMTDRVAGELPPGLGSLIDDLAAPGHGVIMTMGKGGVGKTTVAAAVAVALARRGFHVHLTTTDPAAHLAAAVEGNHVPNLRVSRIDPREETAKYATEVMSSAGTGLDEAGKSLLAEDLRSPCTEEIAVFRAFAQAVAEGQQGFVVLDTAPTGHTILLLDATLAYHREVTRHTSAAPESVIQLLPRLRDPQFTRVLIVTLPEATPVHEAGQLQRDLQRARIEPYAWVINQALAPLVVRDPVLLSRQRHEQPYINEVVTKYAARTALIAWQPEPPVGQQALGHLIDQTILPENGTPSIAEVCA